MTDAVKQARREYFKEWRARNKDKVQEANKKFWAKYAAKKKGAQSHETTT
jgi:hypothetical protein